jgi:dTDP-glucose pyrophosphorylase
LFSVLKHIKKSARGEYELTEAVNALAIDGKMKVVKIKEYWVDMSNKDSLPRVDKQVREAIR